MDRPSEFQTSLSSITGRRRRALTTERTTTERQELQRLLPTASFIRQQPTEGNLADDHTILVEHAAPVAPVSKTKAVRGRGARFCSTFSPWTAEIMYGLIGLAFFVALAAVLKTFDGRPLSDWDGAIAVGHYSVNLSINFIVSTLGTFSKASLAISIEASIAQSKWIWFAHGKRSLLDYKIFDDASRGPLGSARLLLLTKLRDFASLGALIVILSLTFDPFLQLLVTYQSVVITVPSPSIQIARSNFFDKGSETPISTDWIVQDNNTFCGTETSASFDIVGAIQQGFLVSNQSLLLQPQYVCPAANCTWPTFTSLAVCSQCANISSHVQAAPVQNGSFGTLNGAAAVMPSISYSLGTSQSTNISLLNPLGPALLTSGFDISLLAASATADPSQTFTMQDSQTLLFSLMTLYSDESFAMNQSVWESTPIHALECGLSLCTNLYQSSVIDGKLSETITATASKRLPSSYQAMKLLPSSGCPSITNLSSPFLGNSSWAPPYLPYLPRTNFSLEGLSDMRETFNITQAALDSIIEYLQTLVVPSGLSANITLHPDGVLDGSEIMRAVYEACNYSASSSTSSNSSALSSSSPAPVFQNLAYALTSAIRNAGNSQQFQPGSMQIPTTYIQVRWGAITVPAAVLGSTLIFLAICIWRTARLDLKPWKENPLPSLIGGLMGEARTRAKAKLNEKDWTEEALKEVCRGLMVELKEKTKPELRV